MQFNCFPELNVSESPNGLTSLFEPVTHKLYNIKKQVNYEVLFICLQPPH